MGRLAQRHHHQQRAEDDLRLLAQHSGIEIVEEPRLCSTRINAVCLDGVLCLRPGLAPSARRWCLARGLAYHNGRSANALMLASDEPGTGHREPAAERYFWWHTL